MVIEGTAEVAAPQPGVDVVPSSRTGSSPPATTRTARSRPPGRPPGAPPGPPVHVEGVDADAVAVEASVDAPATEEPGTRHVLADRAAALFRSWVDGDDRACPALVALLSPVLWHTARAYRVDSTTAEDVVQNAWLALARRRDHVRDPQAVLAWLLVTVRRDAARSAASARSTVADPDPVLAASPDPSPGPAAVVLDEDRALRLWQAVGRLSERCQRLLRVVAFADRPDYASLSVDLGMPVGSIGPTRGRCLHKLKQELGERGQWTTA